MMPFKRRIRGEQPVELLFYHDYINSQAWEVRKKQYYAKYAKACKICGDTDGVELNHIKYGNYGHERDRDLVPLCRSHHQALHNLIGVRGNMHYQTAHFLRDAIQKHDATHEEKVPQTLYANYSPSILLSIQMALDTISRPIWRFYSRIFRW